jgi:hypothetical protein
MMYRVKVLQVLLGRSEVVRKSKRNFLFELLLVR